MRLHILLGLFVLVAYVNAKPWLRSDDMVSDESDDSADMGGAEQKWEKETLVNYLKEVPVTEIKAKAAQIKADLEKALEAVRELEQVAEPLSADFKLDPKFLEAGSKLGADEAQLAKHMARLPPLPEDKELHFLDDCIKVAKSTDFDQYTEVHVFLNEVIRQVVVCAASGLEVMVDASDLESLDDADITPELVADRMIKLQEAGIEMGHLGKFVMEFFYKVFSGALEKGMTNNELVKGKEGEESDRKGPKPLPPMGDKKDKSMGDKKGPKPGPSFGGNGKGPGKGSPMDDNKTGTSGGEMKPPKDSNNEDDDDENDDDGADDNNDDDANDDDNDDEGDDDDDDDDVIGLKRALFSRLARRYYSKLN